jgi:hypothetical protein
MKVNEILNEVVKESWTIHNLAGVPKKFKDPSSSEAKAWMSDRTNPAADKEEEKRQ